MDMVWFFKFGKLCDFITICFLLLSVSLTVAEDVIHGLDISDILKTSYTEVEHSGIRSWDAPSMRILTLNEM